MDRQVLVERYFPFVLSNAVEFQDIANAENPEYKLLYDLALRWFENGFVMDLHVDGAERWEDMLNITSKASDTLEQRRQRILTRICSMLPYTYRRLEEILAANFGEGMTEIDLQYNKYLLNVNIDKSIVLQKEALFHLLRLIVPANLGVKIRYTFGVQGNIYFGAVAGQRKRLKISPALGFTLTEATTDIYFSGAVGLRKRIQIKAVE